jgi:sec-independent protein translocase protein TatA
MGFLKDIGGPELIIILLIVVMIFGVGKLPQVAASIGKSLKAFKEGQSGDEEIGDTSVKRPRRKASPVKETASQVKTTATKKSVEKPSTTAVKEVV